MATPTVPSRPALPKVPPRPERRPDRTVSPSQQQQRQYDRSPFNSTGAAPHAPAGSQGPERKQQAPPAPPAVAPLARTPSVQSLPSLGQEGNEYASLAHPPQTPSAPEQTRNVAGDLPLHAPRAKIPSSAAKSRIATVTRTDSTQAAAAGIGKADSDAGKHDSDAGKHDSDTGKHDSDTGKHDSDTDGGARDGAELASKHDKSSSRSASAISRPQSSRPQSTHPPYREEADEHGIPEIGLQVPMYPDAGDVQAPTPSPRPATAHVGPGIAQESGFPSPRYPNAKRSGSSQPFVGPPGSYGLHGHGIIETRDPFERAWYEKHPDELEREAQGEYGPSLSHNRAEWALSSDDLNRIVHETGNIGTTGTPDERIGYIASEEYASRIISLHLPTESAKQGSAFQHSLDSPLKQTEFAAEDESAITPKAEEVKRELGGHEGDLDESVIHIDPPSRTASRADNFGVDGPSLGRRESLANEDSSADEYSAPILASDEVVKHPENEYLQPAVPTDSERTSVFEPDAPHHRKTGSNRPGSRPTSRPSSVPSGLTPLGRLTNHDDHLDHVGTQLEEIHEYEPLFPDEEDDQAESDRTDDKEKHSQSVSDVSKQADATAHGFQKFPSNDVWEDTPTSLQLETTVTSPQLPEEDEAKERKRLLAFNQRSVNADVKNAAQDRNSRGDFIPAQTKWMANPNYQAGDPRQAPDRTESRAKFPSRDLWEDTPEHLQLQATVQSPQIPETNDNPLDAAARAGDEQQQQQTKDSIAKPPVPPRPHRAKPSPLAEGAGNDAKPKIPAKPIKPLSRKSTEEDALTRTISADSATSNVSTGSDTSTSAPSARPKPAVPQRPLGGKIAALKAGFMNDLNSRLQAGPPASVSPPSQASKDQDSPVADEEPSPKILSDARKGRAKGPSRRRPATSSEKSADDEERKPRRSAPIGLTPVFTVWQVNDGGELTVSDVTAADGAAAAAASSSSLLPTVSQKSTSIPSTREVATNTDDPVPIHTSNIHTSTKGEGGDGDKQDKKAPVSVRSSECQTGQTDVEIPGADGRVERLTAYIGGAAPEEGNVVVKSNKEVVQQADGAEVVHDLGKESPVAGTASSEEAQ